MANPFSYHNLILPADPFDKNKPDESYRKEFDSASKLFKEVNIGNIIHLYNPLEPLERFKLTKNVIPFPTIYNGWMFTPAMYKAFYNYCQQHNVNLINNPDQYKACHWFEGWYDHIADLTPESIIIKRDEIRPMLDQVLAFMKKNDCGVIFKDQVKSLKHDWLNACFVPKDSNTLHAAKVLSNFVHLKNEMNDFQ